jgi:hypothetical protein
MEISSEFRLASQWRSVAGIPELIAGPTSSPGNTPGRSQRKKKEAAAGLCRLVFFTQIPRAQQWCPTSFFSWCCRRYYSASQVLNYFDFTPQLIRPHLFYK